MNFRPELAQLVIDGRKHVTRRAVSVNPNSPYHLSRAPLMDGKRIAIGPGRGKPRIGSALVATVSRELFSPALITAEEARAEGFASIPAFMGVWADLHGSLDPIDVWRIELTDPEPR